MANAPPVAFTAKRKFVVAPDRYYRVELVHGSLELTKIGSQFAGMNAASPNSEPTGISRGAKTGLILGGVALFVISVVLLFVVGSAGWIVTGFAGTAAAGVIIAITGFVRPTPEQIALGRDNLSIPLSSIQRVELKKPAGRSANAQLILHLKLHNKPLSLMTESENDSRILSELVVPRLSNALPGVRR